MKIFNGILAQILQKLKRRPATQFHDFKPLTQVDASSIAQYVYRSLKKKKKKRNQPKF